MRTAAALLAAATAATARGLREYPSAEAYAKARSGGAPGTYVHYDWAGGQALSDNMEVDHVWTTIPSGDDTHGNGVFASSQYWYKGEKGTAIKAAGYMGSQVMRGSNGQERRVFIFSCWDNDPQHMVGWTTPATCARFGGEGVGSHCILEYPTQPGALYKFRVAMSGHNATGAFWSGHVTDPSGKQTLVGTLYYPNVGSEIGFGKFQVNSNEFLEYFLGGDCDTDVHVAVGTVGPFFHNRTASPVRAYPAYGNGDCKRTSVVGCIPGYGCGHPKVFVQGGAGVVRNNTDQTLLWGPPPAAA
eukprot:TRINITY_DN22285_c0_g1_i1.p1 TRINITY_DN22285_c0_g1~~TRINITY_DN22285_c0_g1_i1.p1  ORF type:complete len:329 (+),score=94.00 TRINITY_DN22285_c0_g1_i1:87-989(+)